VSETLYTYRRTRRPDGTETYERVPYDPNEPVSEPPVLMPKVSPKQCAGPRNGSAVVDRLLANVEAAALRRQAADALEASQRAEQERLRLLRGQAQEEAPRPSLRFKRVVEP